MANRALGLLSRTIRKGNAPQIIWMIIQSWIQIQTSNLVLASLVEVQATFAEVRGMHIQRFPVPVNSEILIGGVVSFLSCKTVFLVWPTTIAT
jgi:hypothetical protein